MSRLMLIGSLRTPVVHDDPVGLIQLHARAMQAADELERLWENNDRMQKLIQDLIDNDPNELISDAGHSVLDLWRHEARKALGPKGDD